MPHSLTPTKKKLFIAFGFVTLTLGVIGIFLPVLPTTPFLLLSAAAWMKSSDRFYSWLIRNRFLGTYIRNYREKRGITLRHKIITISFLWIGIGYTTIFVSTSLWLSLVLFVIATGVTIHLLILRTLPAEKKGADGHEEPPAPGGSSR